MSATYKAMVYFAVATFYFYRASIHSNCKTVAEFRDKNPDIIQRVLDEARQSMCYELSHNQLDIAIAAYNEATNNPQTVEDSSVFTGIKIK